MATKAQIAANRLNAQKSTGPKSFEGKTKVSKNALKHGLCSEESVISGENLDEFELFREELIAELSPSGVIESVLAERIVSLSWRLIRAERIQNMVIEEMIDCDQNMPTRKDPLLFPVDGRRRDDSEQMEDCENVQDLTLGRVGISYCKELERLQNYEMRFESSLHKTIAKLKQLQLMRKQQDEERRHPASSSTTPGQGRQETEVGSKIAKQSQIPKAEDRIQNSQFSSETAKQSQFIGIMPESQGPKQEY